MLPGEQVRRGVNGSVVAECEVGDRVYLEVKVVRRSLGVSGVADEADDLSRLDAVSVSRRGRIGGEMRVVELVPLAVSQPEAVAADVVPTDREDGSIDARENRGAEWSEDVVPVVPIARYVRAQGSERVSDRVVRTVNREDVAACGQLGL